MFGKIALLIKLVFIFGIPLVVGYFSYTTLRNIFLDPADPQASETVLFEIAPDSSFRQVARNLEEAGLLENWWALNVIARVQRSDTSIKAGEYELSAALSPLEIMRKLSRGDVYQRRLTVAEGTSIWDIGAKLESAGIVPQSDFENAIVDMRLVNKAGIEGSSFEGYLFPDTYFFSRPVTVEAVIFRMVQEGDRLWSDELAQQAEKLNMSRHEVLTLASIVEKEARFAHEQPTIAAVFHNRLRVNMRLQADPTVVYALPELEGPLTRAHLKIDSPYNTYTNAGLPPGPICNPGLGAITAVLYPEENNYLYFVADGSGGHRFAETLQQHNRNVKKYRAAMRELD